MNDGTTDLSGALDALRARYGAGSEPDGAVAWNGVVASLLTHRSVRGYRPDPVPPGTLAAMIAAAQSAATSSNLQSWSTVEVTDPAKRAALARIAGGQQHIVECPLFLVWVADLSRHQRLAEATGETFEALPFLETFLVAAIDAALAAQNAVVAAESFGLSTVYIGALRNDPEAVARLIGLPQGAVAVFGLCVGYAKPGKEGEVKPRLPQAAVCHRDRYDPAADMAARRSYDDHLEAFSRRHELAAYTWTDRMLNRLKSVRALNGRDQLKSALLRMGFPLR